jgi:hypothetical protein
MSDPKANPLMFSGNAADMLKQYGQAVPEQQPMSSLEDAQAAKAKMDAEKEPEAHFHDGHACTADHSSEHTHDKASHKEHDHAAHGHKEHSHESHGHKEHDHSECSGDHGHGESHGHKEHDHSEHGHESHGHKESGHDHGSSHDHSKCDGDHSHK